jgi:hypothetical protein
LAQTGICPLKPASGSSSAVERQLPKLDVAGSIPVSRSINSATYKVRKSREAVPALKVAASAHTRLEGYNGGIMADRNIETPSMSEVCARVRHLGYAASRRVRLYGEEFEVVSDPFPEADGIAVHVTTKKDSRIRVLQIPATVLQSVRGRVANAA